MITLIAELSFTDNGDFMVNEKRMLGLLKDLIAANSESPPGYERDAADVLIDFMMSYGFDYDEVGPKERPNLIFYTHPKKLGKLVIHGHLDTVPAGPREQWDSDPFSSEIVGGKLYGRGACDMKGPVTALAETMIRYKEQRFETPLVMLTTADEESGCSGAENVAESGLLEGIEFGVCAEPTDLEVLVGEKGMFWTKLVATGKAAHGSRPDEGVNAIEICIDALRIIKNTEFQFIPDQLMGEPTFNLGMISGGIKINVVPDRCEALLDMRIVKGQDTDSLLSEMNKILDEAGLGATAGVEYVHGKPAVVTPIDAEIVDVSLSSVESITGKKPIPTAATFGTDCSVLQPKIGIINVICGPGSIEQAHQPNEFISLSQLYQSVDVYFEIAKQFAK
jgi:succinyl-diaminopimelate desuccinylase